ncbi:ABC transporter ATP-binding protein [Nocardia blacklockiae]|uniref:ABC transporter ATP-binding protein n=1 Tax=Nocardia blacklockiae TaxID=480036 RepID=UPI001892FB41|nr:ABC transporter ATP-binding protein [Nocardia blacklockiae]MBF6175976.1 ABC transporter ATP-binding protein [Nocardia blacklockiae]
MAVLTLHGLTKRYGKTVGIEDVSLDIADGEFFVILGPSGAGKTTTLKSIAGLVDVDGGSVRIGGTDMTSVEPYHRNVAMAFESYALYPQKTVAQNLASPLRSGRTGKYSEAEQQERIDTVTRTLGIDHLQKRFPRELSNGQRQRVALGRVLVRPADVYLLDEPLSHLDAKLRAAMRAELRELGRLSNTTTVYVTHDYQEALALGDRIGILRDGRLVQVGTPEEIWRRPVDTFVARALGQPEMNIVDAVVSGGRITVPGTGIDIPVGLEVPGGRARLGLRPCDVTVAERGGDRAGVLTVAGRVTLAERLGRNVEVSVDIGGVSLIALSAGGAHVREGAEVALTVPLADVHVFAAGDPGSDSRRLGTVEGGSPAAPKANGHRPDVDVPVAEERQ